MSSEWSYIKRKNPKTPIAFMDALFTMNPNINERDVQRFKATMSVKTWEIRVCDFILICFKALQGSGSAQVTMHQQWNDIQDIMATQNLDDAFASLCL